MSRELKLKIVKKDKNSKKNLNLTLEFRKKEKTFIYSKNLDLNPWSKKSGNLRILDIFFTNSGRTRLSVIITGIKIPPTLVL